MSSLPIPPEAVEAPHNLFDARQSEVEMFDPSPCDDALKVVIGNERGLCWYEIQARCELMPQNNINVGWPS
jgi:hypothetical protein